MSVEKRDNIRRKTSILRKINPFDCNYKQIGNQNLYLHWGIFVENFPVEKILQLLDDDLSADIRRSYIYKEHTNFDEVRIGIGHKPFHFIDFHDVPDIIHSDNSETSDTGKYL